MPVERKLQDQSTELQRVPDYELIYLTLWEGEQEHTRTRWTVTTFFISVSFAIFGFSLQTSNPPVPLYVVHLSSLAIYWFAYLLFLRFNRFTRFMREYLKDMERTGKVSVDLQTQADEAMREHSQKYLSASNLLFAFGLLYSVTVASLWILS